MSRTNLREFGWSEGCNTSGLLFQEESSRLRAVMSHWVVAALCSALFLGVWRTLHEHAVRENAIAGAVSLALTGAVVWGAVLAVDWVAPGALPASLIAPTAHTGFQHLQLALKIPIVAPSWIFTYFD